MRKITLFLACLISSLTNMGQGNFEDVFINLSANDRFSNMLNLRHYQQSDPERAITYYLLGDIFENYLKEADPLKYIGDIEMYHAQAITYYNLLLLKIDDKQTRQDREYFLGIKKKTDEKRLEREDIVAEINNRIIKLNEYLNHAKTVHQNYVQFITKYNECLFEYRQILTNFPRYKDLYLLITPELKSRIEKINSNFRETIKYFNTYQAACTHFTHLFIVPKYTLKPIVTYRLEGLVETDYATSNVELWDYSSWGESFLNVVNTDIKNIREQLVLVDSNLDRQIKIIQNNNVYSDDIEIIKPDIRFKNLIGKYDNNSIANQLLNYKESKVDYLQFSRKAINDPTKIDEKYLINSLIFFKDLAYLHKDLNKEVAALQKSVNIENIEKYSAFFDSNYKGMDRFIRWCDVEKYNNDMWFNKNLKNLELFLQREEHKNDFKGEIALYNKKKSIALGIQNTVLTSIIPDTLITQYCEPIEKKSIMVAGIDVGKDSIVSPFLAQIDTSLTVRWLVNPQFRSGKSDVSAIFVTDAKFNIDSTTIMLITKHITSDTCSKFENYIVRYNWSGNELSRQLIDTLGIPVYFHFEEITGEYLLVTEQKSTISERKESILSVSNITPLGQKKWVQSFQFQGNFVDVVITNANFFLFMNTSSFDDLTGYSFSSSNSDCLGIYIDNEGKVRSYHQFKFENNLQLTNAQKINSNNFSLFGNIDSKNNDNNLFYMLIDPNGDIVYKNIETLTVLKHQNK